MKKVIRVLGLGLVLGLSFVSCTDEKSSEPETSLETKNLKGIYKYQGVSVASAVDTNGDGIFNNDLIKEGYNACGYDNTLEITDTQYTFQMKGTQCDPSETNLSFTYTIDKANAKITLFENGQSAGEITNVKYYSFNGIKTYEYQVYSQSLKQNIAYVMESIN